MNFSIEALEKKEKEEEKKPEEKAPAPLPSPSPSSPTPPAAPAPSPSPALPAPSPEPEISVPLPLLPSAPESEEPEASSPDLHLDLPVRDTEDAAAGDRTKETADTGKKDGTEEDTSTAFPTDHPSEEMTLPSSIVEEPSSEPETFLPPRPKAPELPPQAPPSAPPAPENLPAPPSPEEKARKVFDRLTSGINKNAVQYTAEKGTPKEDIRTILWVKGIEAPKVEEMKQYSSMGYAFKYSDYKAGQGWYDVNKSHSGHGVGGISDAALCFGAVAGNMLHWWLEQNEPYIQTYLTHQKELAGKSAEDSLLQTYLAGEKEFLQERKTKLLSDNHLYLNSAKTAMLESLQNSFRGQQDSRIFQKFTREFGFKTEGFQTDLLVDMVINGYKPKNNSGTNDSFSGTLGDEKGGLFYPVFGAEKITERRGDSGYGPFSNSVRETLMRGGMVGITYALSNSAAHIITVWGAEFDSRGNMIAVYISDSDDQGEEPLGMKRFEVRNTGISAVLGTNQEKTNSGSPVFQLHLLYSGEEIWKKYFEKHSLPLPQR